MHHSSRQTCVFFASLFIMVGSLVNLGITEMLGTVAVKAVVTNYIGAATGLLIGSVVFSGIVDNTSYVATRVQAGGDPAQPPWWALALALGADLGGNATAIGASAIGKTPPAMAGSRSIKLSACGSAGSAAARR